MEPFKSSDEIFGNWATVLLPIEHDDSINYSVLSEQIEYLTHCGLNGIYSNGTAGEFYTQSEEEFDRINEILATSCKRKNVSFQIGASHMSPHISLERIKRAKKLKPKAIQVILPDWSPVNDEEVITCLQRFAEEAFPIGIILYNPPHSKRVLKPEVYSKVKTNIPNLLGIKVSDGDNDWYRAVEKHCSHLSVFVPGHHLATGFSRGAAGSYSNMACLNPVGAQKWYEQMKTDLEGALELEKKIQKFNSNYILPFITKGGYSNQAVDKLLASIGGWSQVGTRLRWPYHWIPEYEAERLRPIAKNIIPEFFNLS